MPSPTETSALPSTESPAQAVASVAPLPLFWMKSRLAQGGTAEGMPAKPGTWEISRSLAASTGEPLRRLMASAQGGGHREGVGAGLGERRAGFAVFGPRRGPGEGDVEACTARRRCRGVRFPRRAAPVAGPSRARQASAPSRAASRRALIGRPSDRRGLGAGSAWRAGSACGRPRRSGSALRRSRRARPLAPRRASRLAPRRSALGAPREPLGPAGGLRAAARAGALFLRVAGAVEGRRGGRRGPRGARRGLAGFAFAGRRLGGRFGQPAAHAGVVDVDQARVAPDEAREGGEEDVFPARVGVEEVGVFGALARRRSG